MKTAIRVSFPGSILTLSICFLAAPICFAQGPITTLAGGGRNLGDGGPAVSATASQPDGITVDGSGNVYFAELGDSRVRKINPAGVINTILGNGSGGHFYAGVALDGSGNLYVADGTSVIKVTASGSSSTFVTSNGFTRLGAIALDASGNLYVADVQGHQIKKVTPTGTISVVAGTGTRGFTADGGKATAALITYPAGLAVDAAGNVYFIDSGSQRVRKVDSSGILTTVAGGGTAAGDGGLGSNAVLSFSLAALSSNLALDNKGNLYIAEDGTISRIRKVDAATGIITTVVGPGTAGVLGDGGSSTLANILTPNGISVDAAGNILISDTGHSLVREAYAPSTTPPFPPVVSAVVNGASLLPALPTNSWVTLKGQFLAGLTTDWTNSIVNGALPTTVGGISVSIGGKPAYVYYVSPGQLNVLAPDLPPGQVTVTVKTNAGTSSPVNATAATYDPAPFLWPQNQVVATRQDFSYAVGQDTFPGLTTVAAKQGEVLILWMTGLGPTNPPAPVGVAVPGDRVYSTTTLPTVTIGGVSATVYGAALAAGSVGLYQVAIQVPSTVPNGNRAVQVSIGGVTSPSTSLIVGVAGTPK